MTGFKHVIAGLFAVAILVTAGGFAQAKDSNMASLIEKGAAQLSTDADKARKTFELAIVSDPKSSIAYAYLGQAHLALDHVRAARKYFAIALELDPDNLDALGWAGVADLKANNVRLAEARLGRLLRLCGGECAPYDLLTNAIADFETKRASKKASGAQ